MIYLKEFATAQDYEDVKNNLPKPNVSLITNGSEVKYMKETTPPTPVEHEYVDLGLPSGTLWATMNIGASSITDTGLYYQWGDTQGYLYNEHEWGESTYKWFDVENDVYTKYNYTDGKRGLDDADDAAIAAWGNGWHIPTKAQFVELIDEDNVTTAWTTDYQGSGVSGLVITSRINNNTLFLPSNMSWGDGRYRSNATYDQGNNDGGYEYCVGLLIGDWEPEVVDEHSLGSLYRRDGHGIRPVKDA